MSTRNQRGKEISSSAPQQRVGSAKQPPSLMTTQSMLQSFIFSKPASSIVPFSSWGAAERAQQAAQQDHRRAMMGAYQHSPVESPSSHSPSRTLRPPLEDISLGGGAAEDYQPTNDANLPVFDLALARRAMTTAWKRRSFVDNVNDIPQAYQHKSVVPAVPLSPRTLQAHHRPATGGAANRPMSGVLPAAPRPGTASHPMKTAVAHLGPQHDDQEWTHTRQRRSLASRVVHLRDYSRGVPFVANSPPRGLYGTVAGYAHDRAGAARALSPPMGSDAPEAEHEQRLSTADTAAPASMTAQPEISTTPNEVGRTPTPTPVGKIIRRRKSSPNEQRRASGEMSSAESSLAGSHKLLAEE